MVNNGRVDASHRFGEAKKIHVKMELNQFDGYSF